MNQNQRSDTHDGSGHSVAERLARETNTPVEEVNEIYEIETAALERTARIKTFVNVLAIHRTRVVLNSRSAPRSR